MKHIDDLETKNKDQGKYLQLLIYISLNQTLHEKEKTYQLLYT